MSVPFRSVDETIQEMARRIVEKFHPEKIILFGSHARGTATPDSDVDLLVVMPVKGPRRHVAAQLYVLLAGMGIAKDIVVVTPADLKDYADLPGTIIQPALQEGKTLYDRAA